MITFEKADVAIHDQLREVRDTHHPDLCDPSVTVDILMTQDIDGDGEVTATLKHHGYPAIATIKATSLKERVLGHADALLTIDAVRWGGLTAKEQTAVLDHELMHLEVKRDGDGEPVLDDAGRPKLKMRQHDWELGGFTEVARRHGEHAAEVRAVRSCVGVGGQYYWDWDGPKAVEAAE